MIGFALFVLALVLIFLLTFINYWNVENKSKYFLSTATNLDIFANREFRATWNKWLITSDGYKFGKLNETISSALGKNQMNGTLTTCGKVLVWILDILEENHCLKSINTNI